MPIDLRPSPTPQEAVPLSRLERAVLLTVLYADLFDHPLTAEEIGVWLVGEQATTQEVRATLARLEGSHLSCCEGLYTWPDRTEVVDIRRRRQRSSAPRWQQAEKFARTLWSVPFVRMVAVCGSQAMDNGDEDGDIDIFCIGEQGRMWLVQCAAMVLRRISGLRGSRVCPNYLLSSGDLGVGTRNLYLAHEIAQTVPLRGGDLHRRFLEANDWVAGLLPNFDPESRRRRLVDEPPPRGRERWERWLAGRTGDLLDALVHRLLLVYYPLRLWRRGWSRESFRRTYSRDRQEVMAGGYAPTVRAAFVQGAELRLGPRTSAQTVLDLFPESGKEGPPGPDPHFSRMFVGRYGGATGSRPPSDPPSHD